MKLVISAADYAMTESITDGCIRAIRDGILMDVGIMTNNYKQAKRGAEELKKYPHVSVGMDINFVSGVPASDPKDIPSLVDENGIFIRSIIRNKAKREGHPMLIAYEDAYLEAENQVKRYIEFFQHRPPYMNGHSYSDEPSERAIVDICKKYNIPWCVVFEKELNIKRPDDNWYKMPNGSESSKEGFNNAEIQRNVDVVDHIINDRGHLLANEYSLLRMHIGYTDADLYRMSSYHDIRVKEMSALCDERVKKWVKDNNIEVINYEDFFKECPFSWEGK